MTLNRDCGGNKSVQPRPSAINVVAVHCSVVRMSSKYYILFGRRMLFAPPKQGFNSDGEEDINEVTISDKSQQWKMLKVFVEILAIFLHTNI